MPTLLSHRFFGQWEYVDGIGADASGSEVDTYDNKDPDETVQDIWDKVHKTFNVLENETVICSCGFAKPGIVCIGALFVWRSCQAGGFTGN
jgi:hypothetical protein